MSARTQGELRMARARAERTALESSPPAGRVRTVHAHRKDIAPLEATRMDPANPAAAIDAIRARVNRCIRAGVTTYLFIDEEFRVFVVSEVHASCARWAQQHGDWLVGVYGSARGRDQDQLADDLAERMKELPA